MVYVSYLRTQAKSLQELQADNLASNLFGIVLLACSDVFGLVEWWCSCVYYVHRFNESN